MVKINAQIIRKTIEYSIWFVIHFHSAFHGMPIKPAYFYFSNLLAHSILCLIQWYVGCFISKKIFLEKIASELLLGLVEFWQVEIVKRGVLGIPAQEILKSKAMEMGNVDVWVYFPRTLLGIHFKYKAKGSQCASLHRNRCGLSGAEGRLMWPSV